VRVGTALKHKHMSKEYQPLFRLSTENDS